jgi:hypothetical protein
MTKEPPPPSTRVCEIIGRHASGNRYINILFSYIVIECYIIFFYHLVCETIGTAATPGLLCQPRVIVKMIVEKQMECRLAGETQVLGGNLPQRHFCPSQINPT